MSWRSIAEQYYARIAELEAEVERTRDAWMETAAHHCRNEKYYRGLVVRIGEMLPLPGAYVSDDGSGQDSVLCAKVPELVRTSVDRIAELEAKLASIQIITAAGNRTLDEMIRDMKYANDHARAALSGEGVT